MFIKTHLLYNKSIITFHPHLPNLAGNNRSRILIRHQAESGLFAVIEVAEEGSFSVAGSCRGIETVSRLWFRW